MIFESVKTGFGQTWANKRLIAVFYLVNLILGLAIAIPIAGLVDSFVGKSMIRDSLAAGMDWNFLFEFLDINHKQLPGMGNLFFFIPLIFVLSILFLSGGAIGVFAGHEKYKPSEFWGNCGQYFGRFFRLALMSIPLLAILFSIRLLADGIERLFFGADPYENLAYWFGVAKIGLGIIGLLLYGLVLDYARIYMVINDEIKSRVALWRGLKFAVGNIGRTFSLALILFLTGLAVLFVYYHLSNLLSSSHVAIILLLVLFQQIYILWRVILRLTFYSGQVNFYKRINPGDTIYR
ncbi:MAG: hypothetical protein V3W18_11820 [candidate division Zixibacteria bacterium]